MCITKAGEAMKIAYVSYAMPLKVARYWLSQGGEQLFEAVTLLVWLREQYPHALDVGHELALALLESGKSEEAETLAQSLRTMTRSPNEEVFGRLGRLYRDRGDLFSDLPDVPRGDASARPDDERARDLYSRALRHYEKAYEIRNGYYPGINVAVLRVILAGLAVDQSSRNELFSKAIKISEYLIQQHQSNKWPAPKENEIVWQLATAGEFLAILGHWEEADKYLTSAVTHALLSNLNVNSIGKQQRRLIHYLEKLGKRPTKALEAWQTLAPELHSRVMATLDAAENAAKQPDSTQ